MKGSGRCLGVRCEDVCRAGLGIHMRGGGWEWNRAEWSVREGEWWSESRGGKGNVRVYWPACCISQIGVQDRVTYVTRA